MNEDDQHLFARELLMETKGNALISDERLVAIIADMNHGGMLTLQLDDDARRIAAEINEIIPQKADWMDSEADDWERREKLTQRLLEDSLCPLHRIDYAICFDDDNPDCVGVRIIHPSHDT